MSLLLTLSSSFLILFIIKPKISLFSRYERVTDRRTYKERRDVFALVKDEPLIKEPPKKVIKELQNVKKPARRLDKKKFEIRRRGRKLAEEQQENEGAETETIQTEEAVTEDANVEEATEE